MPLERGRADGAVAVAGGGEDAAASADPPTHETDGAAGPSKPSANPAPGCQVSSRMCFKVVLASGEAAKQLMITKRTHRQLGTGIVVRQALALRECAVQQAFMPQYRDMRRDGEPVDFRRGRLFRRLHAKWIAMPLPDSVRAT